MHGEWLVTLGKRSQAGGVGGTYHQGFCFHGLELAVLHPVEEVGQHFGQQLWMLDSLVGLHRNDPGVGPLPGRQFVGKAAGAE